jgi:tetratricopeptide (TPR) repeat protein
MTAAVRTALSAERPFPGLRPYAFEDSQFYFGREDQIYSLYRLLDRSRFIAVVGSSGSGKSSLVRAGLLPLLDAETQNAGGRSWRWVEMRPGDAPLSRLAEAVASLSPPAEDAVGRAVEAARRERIAFALRQSSFGLAEALDKIEGLGESSFVLVVDQFEELFRYATTAASHGHDPSGEARWREDAAHFVQLLLEISRSRTRPVHVLITMRSDFIGDCARFHGLPEAVSATQFLVPSLTRDQREEVIRKPIEKAGATIEPASVERLLNDSGDDLDQLPVVQHCLMRLWDRAGADAAKAPRSGEAGARETEAPPAASRHLTLEHYRAVGSIAGALSQHAEEILASLPGLELAVEQVFRALAEIDKEGRAIRRAISFGQLVAETGIPEDQLRQVVDRLRADDCSFLVPPPSLVPELTSETRIDVGHEALLRRWERLSGDPVIPGHGASDRSRQTGWLRIEDADGRLYRALLALVDSGDCDGTTLPLDQVETRWKWWTSRPRTVAWADRYGGGFARVQRLFENSLAALTAAREAIQRKAVAQGRRRRYTMGTMAACLVGALGFAWYALTLKREAEEAKTAALEQKDIARHALAAATGTANALVFDWAKEFRGRTGMPVDLVRKILERAQELQRQLAQSGEATPESLHGQAVALSELAATLAVQGSSDAGVAAGQQARDILKRLLTVEPTNIHWQAALADSHHNTGLALQSAGRAEDAVEEFHKGRSLREELVAADPTKPEWLIGLALSYSAIGDAHVFDPLITAERKAEVIDSYNKALAIREKLAEADPDNPDRQAELAASYSEVADTMEPERREEKIKTQQKAVALFAKAMAANPSRAQTQRDLVVQYSKLSPELVASGRHDEAVAAVREGTRIGEKLADGDPGNVELQDVLLSIHHRAGDVLAAAGRAAEALEANRRELAILERLAVIDPLRVQQYDLSFINRLGETLAAARQHTEAIETYRRALAIVERFGLANPDKGEWWQGDLWSFQRGLGGTLAAAERHADALEAYRKGLAIAEKSAAANPDNGVWQEARSVSLDKIGEVLVALDRRQEALGHYRGSLAIREKLAAVEPGNPQREIDLARSLFKLAEMADDPATHLKRAVEITRRLSAEGKLPEDEKELAAEIEQAYAKLP